MKRAIITGAADGIGLALAERFAQANYMIIGIDVDAQKACQTESLSKQKNLDVTFIIADLTTDSGIDHVLKTLTSETTIDLCIHNAGINAVGRFEQLDLAAQYEILRLNLLAPLQLTAGLLKQNNLVAGGVLVFMASLSHFVSYPGAAVYAASKDGLVSYARSLHVGLNRHNIHTLTVYPGPTRTAHARRYSPDNSREHRRMAPELLAEHIFWAVQKRKRTLIPGFGNKIFAIFGKYAPTLTEIIMRRTLFEKIP